MAMVIKKGGKKKEAFSSAKLKRAVTKAYAEAKEEFVSEVVKSVTAATKGKKEIKASVLRQKALKKIGMLAPIVGKTWRKYEKKKRK